jgi:hypothetical protein
MTDTALPWRPEFLAALRLLARISEAMAARGFSRPVLVGGGAVEFYTGSMIMTGDIDLTSPVQPELEEEMQRLGFVRPSGPGRSLRGWIHPDLGLGFEVVGSSPMDGNTDRAYLLFVEAVPGEGDIAVLSVEDMIADRMGQYASQSGGSDEMREQAREMLHLHADLDFAYLERRIRTETAGDHGIEDIEGRT